MLVEVVPDLYGSGDMLTEDDGRLIVSDIETSRGKWIQGQVSQQQAPRRLASISTRLRQIPVREGGRQRDR